MTDYNYSYMSANALLPTDYAAWLAELKTRIHSAQQRASLAVNRELVLLYWQIGQDILARQGREGWGSKVIERLAQDLRSAFPTMKGFSRANLMYMRAFAQAWPEESIVQQFVGQLPWGHNLVLLTKLKTDQQRLGYAQKAVEHGWSRNMLAIHIERKLLEREGKAVTNFETQLPKPQSDLALESLKDPYLFDFLGIGDEAGERALEEAIVQHITKFLPCRVKAKLAVCAPPSSHSARRSPLAIPRVLTRAATPRCGLRASAHR